MSGSTFTPPYITDLDWDCYLSPNESDVNYTCWYENLYPDSRGPKDPSYYSLKYQIVGTVVQGIVLIVGILGNIMVVIVVTRTRSMHTPTNCYLVSLSTMSSNLN
ncbi:thyroliberin receptor [Caerostris darwini]|uniref:Thyrotropin-releasing hormone receptor n=1 Tax=Caerostris darwini TaxID=1538125 RepID=A0AAV4QKX1_9ARAC|nr:thyroliberin receptor [Caerostris darwini]